MEEKPKHEVITESSGNVFADLGFENPEGELAKAKLVQAISSAIESKGLTQTKVAQLIHLDQPQVSRLLRGQTGGYSTDRLIKILNLLGQDVEIRVKSAPTSVVRSGKVSVSYVAEPKRAYKTNPDVKLVAD